MNDRERGLVRRQGIIHGGNPQHRARRDVGPVHTRIEPPDQFGMGMAFLRDEFQFGFVIERRLLRFGEPGFAERLEAGEVIGRDRVGRQDGGVKREPRLGVRVEQPRAGKILGLLKDRNGRPRLRAQRGINRTRRNPPAGQGHLRFKDPMHRARKIPRRLAAQHQRLRLRPGRGDVSGRDNLSRMFMPPETDGEGQNGQHEQPAKASPSARFASRAGRARLGVARHAEIKPQTKRQPKT